MAHSKTTGGSTAKSHKSRKTVPVSAPGGDTSLVTAAPQPTVLPQNPLATVLPAAPTGEGGQPPAPPADVVPTPEPPHKQWWWRRPDSKARTLMQRIVVMDAAGLKDADIAKKLKTTPATISTTRYIAKKNGWLTTDEDGDTAVIDLETELAMNVDRKVVRNIDAALDGHMTNWQTHEMTIAAAKGRGIFKGDAVKTPDGELSVVAIQVIMPTIGASDQVIVEGSIGGTPAYVEGEVEKE